ncbi:hypothetical protein HDU87_007305 [Geranomyces variabilis]|uniref:Uncharacterized protein n=1 Tax=Geranomyces variabilis TaxID=109894 RepID=A0AAD5TFP4_9FUNG|nr:hypothetical protein HDU87_007305 [Geranomyces variabilis]
MPRLVQKKDLTVVPEATAPNRAADNSGLALVTPILAGKPALPRPVSKRRCNCRFFDLDTDWKWLVLLAMVFGGAIDHKLCAITMAVTDYHG